MDVAGRIRIAMAAGVAFTAAGAIALAGTVEAGAPVLLPDLRTVSPGPDALDLRVGNKSGRIILRISNMVGNSGEGPMELYSSAATPTGGPGGDTDCTEGEFPAPAGADRDANQRIYEDTDGSGDFDPEEDGVGQTPKVGCFEYHAVHDHWHFQDFAQFRFETAGGEPIAGIEPSRKIGFCIFDGHDFPDFPPDEQGEDTYSGSGCNQGDPNTGPDGMGLSVGWADRYSYSTPGQRLNITGVTRGEYCLVSVANPPDPPNPPPFRSEIVESDETNNDRRKLIRVNPNQRKAKFLDGSC
jgi:Lysyl oxidase